MDFGKKNGKNSSTGSSLYFTHLRWRRRRPLKISYFPVDSSKTKLNLEDDFPLSLSSIFMIFCHERFGYEEFTFAYI